MPTLTFYAMGSSDYAMNQDGVNFQQITLQIQQLVSLPIPL